MYSFRNDYSEGAHPQVLEALCRYNLEQNAGYGLDAHSAHAADQIRELCACPQAAVHFISGGTQTNMLLISSCLRPFQAVIATETGHIHVHETGAVEATGHKILTVPAASKSTPDTTGKLTPEDIRTVCAAHMDEHMVQPALVYISDSTELGTIYCRQELEALHAVCKELGLWLFLDGARLGAALTCPENDLTLADIAALTDAFYIGGTKNGALYGEALVLTNPLLQKDFRYAIKNRGAMLAKGFTVGIQFEALFTDQLYFKLAEHAGVLANKLTAALKALHCDFYAPSPTNQVFPILPDTVCQKLAEDFQFETQKQLEDGRFAVRFVTSWATPEEAVDSLIASLSDLLSV